VRISLYKGRDQAMDTHTRILRWERAIQENPAIIVLAIIVLLAVIFIGVLLIDGYLKKKKERKRRRGKR
jgi:hypothetical protein